MTESVDSLSDLDLGIIFGGKDLSINEVLELQADLQELFPTIRLDLVLLEKAYNNVAFSAIADGQLIYSTDEELRLDFEENVMRIYHDFTPFMELFYRDMEKAISREDIGDRI